jgi:hypothetical protein
MWFDVDFPIPDQSHEVARVVLSTQPEREMYSSTHWRQSILYFQNYQKNAVPVKGGQKLEGSIALRKTPENPRWIHLKLSARLSPDSEVQK